MELKDLRLLGGKLCIDFANSYDNIAPGERLDFIASYQDLVQWCHHVDFITDRDAAELAAVAAQQQRAADGVYQRAVELRCALRTVLRAIAEADDVPPGALEVIQQEYRRTVDAIRLEPVGDRFDWDLRPNAPKLDQVLWPITLSAVDLLTGGDTRRIKLCASHDCGWLFYDQSKNRSRRWCSMEGCGSQDKMRRLYRRRKQQAERA